MIVRIMGEGQLRLAESHLAELNTLDDALAEELGNGDGSGYTRTLRALLDRVRELGEPLPADSLEPSDLILPAPEASLAEVRALLRGDEGLLPG